MYSVARAQCIQSKGGFGWPVQKERPATVGPPAGPPVVRWYRLMRAIVQLRQKHGLRDSLGRIIADMVPCGPVMLKPADLERFRLRSGLPYWDGLL